jgi:hypothetical protein
LRREKECCGRKKEYSLNRITINEDQTWNSGKASYSQHRIKK